MSIFIVRRKGSFVESAVGLVAQKLDPKNREDQIEEFVRLRSKDPIQKDIRDWMSDTRGVSLVSKGEAGTPITGAQLLEMTAAQAEQMREDLPNVAVIADRPIHLIPPNRAAATAVGTLPASKLWHLKAIRLTALRKQGFGRTGTGVTIAVLDTGIDESHPELTGGRIAAAYTFNVKNWEAVQTTPSLDTDGHGTHVAGLICGKKVGVAPGAKVISGVMIPNGQGSLAEFILALEWVASQPEVQIVNMSAGIPGYLPEMHQALADLLAVGVLPVIATGNEGRNRTRSPGNYVEVVSVGASNEDNEVASFSSSGTIVADNHQYTVPDLVAPGQGVYSCVRGGGYEAWDGTSMAAPIVAGIAALTLQKYPQITITDLIEALMANCKDLQEAETRQGHGLLQVVK